jgi:hypothetical protein
MWEYFNKRRSYVLLGITLTYHVLDTYIRYTKQEKDNVSIFFIMTTLLAK